MKKAILLLALALGFYQGQAQSNELGCGTEPAPASTLNFITSLHENKVFEQFDVERVQNTIFIPLKIHIIGNDAGLGYYSIQNLMANICELNQKYHAHGIQFFIRGTVNYINSTQLFNLPSFAVSSAANTQYNVNRCINVYFANLSSMTPPLCGFANFPQTGAPNEPLRQGAIWLSPACSAPGNSTFAHEMGHFLNLPHPFDQTSDAPASPLSERVTRNTSEPSPRLSANCTTAGDRFCDTPADFRPDRWNCPGANSTVIDANGDLFQPDGTLYMSYANDACQNKFSVQQTAAMRATLTITQSPTGQNITGPRMYLLIPPVEPYDTITGTANILEPSNNSTGHPANWTFFRWNRVPGATMYVLRIRRNITLTEEIILYNGDTSYLYTGNKLNAGQTYNVSILPFNHKVTCRPYGPAINFTSAPGFGTSVEDQGNKYFNVYPSLLTANAPLRVKTGEAVNQSLNFEILDVQGRLVQKGSIQAEGSEHFEIPTDMLNNGAFILRLQQGDRAHFQRFVVGR